MNVQSLRLFNGYLWILLGILIVIWMIYPLELLEFIIWGGFALGCILTGLLSVLQENPKIPESELFQIQQRTLENEF